MIKAILIDDEQMALEELKYSLKEYVDIQVVQVYSDPVLALQELNNCKPDVVFLDIEMPEINGFTVAEEILAQKPDTCIIFVTAYDQYAIKAFEVNAVDYILKPIDKRRLNQTIAKVKKICIKNKETTNVDSISSLCAQLKPRFDKIIVWENEEIILLEPSTVFYLKVQEGNVLVVTEKKVYKTRNTLYYWEERLKHHNFFRCHKSFIINLDKVKKIVPMFNNTFIVKLTNHKEDIPVSRIACKELKKILGI